MSQLPLIFNISDLTAAPPATSLFCSSPSVPLESRQLKKNGNCKEEGIENVDF